MGVPLRVGIAGLGTVGLGCLKLLSEDKLECDSVPG